MQLSVITVITVVRNGAGTIRHCLASVRQQTVGAEHIVMDGQSTDGTLEIIAQEQARHPGLIVISEPDMGIYDAMRKGIARASGEVIGCLNADDFYANSKVLEHVSQVFADPTVDSCYGDLVYVKSGKQKAESGNRALTPPRNPNPNRNRHPSPAAPQGSARENVEPALSRAQPRPGGEPGQLDQVNGQFCLPGERVVRRWRAGAMVARAFYWGWMPPHPTFFVRRSVYERCGPFRLDLGTAADYELMLRFLVKHGISTRYLPEVMVKMRVGGVSNASLRNRLRANRNDGKAWAVNGLRPYPWTLLLKPMRKLGQWVG